MRSRQYVPRITELKNSKLASAFELKVEGCLRYLTKNHYLAKPFSKLSPLESAQKEPASKYLAGAECDFDCEQCSMISAFCHKILAGDD